MALLAHNPTRSVARLPALPRPSMAMIGGVLAALFLLLTGDAMINERAFFDLDLARRMQRIDLPLLETVLRPVDMLTSSRGAVVTWVALLAGFALARWWLPALAMLTLPAGGAVNYLISEFLVGRTRPGANELDRVIGHTDAASFPSGHVLGAVMLYGLLFVVAGRITPRPLAWLVKAGAVAVIGLIGFARIWYGAHWPSDVLGAYALGGVLLLALIAAYRRIDAAAGHLPFIRAGSVAHDHDAPHAHALTSVVLFNGERVAKVYAPGFLPRAIYWLAFQAPFPYIRNLAALRAARHRRALAGMLTEYWYGMNRVAPVLDIEPTAGQYALVSAFVDGRAPSDRAAAKAFLRDLRDRFEQAGLPTWQIDPRQPRAIDNLLETADGAYQIVDLESGLVSPLASLKTWWRAIRRGLAPIFDDVFFDITREYVAAEQARISARLGDGWFAALVKELELAETAAAEWHAGEPRLWGRALRAVQAGFYLRSWPATVRARLAGSQQRAQDWIARAIDSWQEDARVSPAEAAEMRRHMNGAEFQAMLPHFGAHIVISILLRFPFGSIARALWSAGALATATVRLLSRRIDRTQWRLSWSIHSPLVIVLSAIPGFGGFAYLAARPVRSNRLLLRATVDAVMQKSPWRLYQRSGLQRLVARPAGYRTPAISPPEAITNQAAVAPRSLHRQAVRLGGGTARYSGAAGEYPATGGPVVEPAAAAGVQ